MDTRKIISRRKLLKRYLCNFFLIFLQNYDLFCEFIKCKMYILRITSSTIGFLRYKVRLNRKFKRTKLTTSHHCRLAIALRIRTAIACSLNCLNSIHFSSLFYLFCVHLLIRHRQWRLILSRVHNKFGTNIVKTRFNVFLKNFFFYLSPMLG